MQKALARACGGPVQSWRAEPPRAWRRASWRGAAARRLACAMLQRKGAPGLAAEPRSGTSSAGGVGSCGSFAIGESGLRGGDLVVQALSFEEQGASDEPPAHRLTLVLADSLQPPEHRLVVRVAVQARRRRAAPLGLQ